ncbi:hypothetical protein RRG08_031032 [Elysia crispata]|uniref:Uncharacterized protein n=1 Tax=Elysia crispata TaxID=231223 RepID=A0AAE1DG44_9GAST|nr:hypothetical protein RRG08_031032 [Elysia crispata]
MTEIGMTAQQFTERLDRMLNAPDTKYSGQHLTHSLQQTGNFLVPTVSLPAHTQNKEILQHPQMDDQMVKSLTASLVSREEEGRHKRNLNENEQPKKQTAEMEDRAKVPNH